MRRGTLQIGLCLFTLMAGGTARAELTLVSGGRTDYTIMRAAAASPAVDYAAQELQHWLKEISGVELPILGPGEPSKQSIVLLEMTPGQVVNGKEIGAEGYSIDVNGPNLVIAGGSPRGILYGVYGLLEDQLGCHWFTPEVSSIPKLAEIKLPDLHVAMNPILEYREPFVFECFDGDWAARNRTNGQTARLTEKHGGQIKYNGFVHTFAGLVPVEQYYDKHPEYFALVGGKRLKERTQLCCTNPEVVKIITDAILKRIEEHPEANVLSVSQNDWYYYCECDKCQAIAKAEDSQIGPVLQMVNEVAKVVAAKYPGKLIDTLAYQWTRKPPKNLRPEPNVIVRLCSIECCFAHSFTKCDSPMNKEFVKDVEGWGKICNRLWVWDYTTTFAAYVTPFPNLRVRADNIRFFEANNVKGIFEQDVYNTPGGELDGLSGYLGAKLLWDPNYDSDRAINEYLNGVYGAAGPHIRRYLDALHDKVDKDNIHVTIGATPEDKYFTDALMATADECFDAAEKAVEGQPDVLQRVRIARMSTDYVVIERTRHDADKVGQFDHEHFIIEPKPDFAVRLKRFIAAGDAVRITDMREQGLTWAEYKEPLPGLLREEPMTPHPAIQAEAGAPGWQYLYYSGFRNTVKGMGQTEPTRKGTLTTIGLDQLGTLDPAFSVIARGLFNAKQSGIYSFHLQSNDGSALYIDGEKVVDNDGDHRLLTKSGEIALAAGLHSIAVRYYQAGGGMGLSLEYQGPKIIKQVLPVDMIVQDASGKNIADSIE